MNALNEESLDIVLKAALARAGELRAAGDFQEAQTVVGAVRDLEGRAARPGSERTVR